MKLRKLSVVLLALLLAAMAMVPIVSAQIATENPKNIVDNVTITDRTPPLLLELESKGLTEGEIAQYLLKMPKPRQSGWTDADNDKALKLFEQYPEKTMTGVGLKAYEVQKDGRMVINENNYHGINGYMKPGNMEVSSTGTQAHYFTSHLGNSGNWIEVGVARFYTDPSQYIVYTVDSGRPAGQQWNTWGTTDPNTDHNFITYVYDYDGSGYPYAIWWDSTLIDSGHLANYNNNPDEVHEFFAGSASSFQSCSQGYFQESFLYKKEGSSYNAYWWNGGLPETTNHYSLSPVWHTMTVPSGSSSYKLTTWI
jgi:hypothetical protein